MAIFRNIQMSFWTDSKVVDEFTPEDRYFYLYLLTNPHTNLCGCYEVSIKQMSDETGYTKEVIKLLLDRFEKSHNVIRYSNQTKEILLLHWNRFNWTKSPKFQKPLITQIENIKDLAFRNYLVDIFNSASDTVSIPYPYGSDTVSIPYKYPIDTVSIPYDGEKDQIDKADNENEIEKVPETLENTKDIDKSESDSDTVSIPYPYGSDTVSIPYQYGSDTTVYVSKYTPVNNIIEKDNIYKHSDNNINNINNNNINNIYKEREGKNENDKVEEESEKHKIKNIKHKYGEYKHVLLTDEEHKKLIDEFGEEETEKAVIYLDEYIEMKGAKYKNCYLAIRKWVFDAVKAAAKEKASDKSNRLGTFGNYKQTSKDSEWEELQKLEEELRGLECKDLRDLCLKKVNGEM